MDDYREDWHQRKKRDTNAHYFFFFINQNNLFFHGRKRRMYLNSWTALYSYIYIYTITYNPQLNVTHKFIID